MINPKDRSSAWQSLAYAAGVIPPLLYGLYAGFPAVGFSGGQALDLARVYPAAVTASGGVRL